MPLNNGTFSLLYNKLLRSLISVSIMLSVSCYAFRILVIIHIHLTQSIRDCSQRTIRTKNFHRKVLNAIVTLQAVVHEITLERNSQT